MRRTQWALTGPDHQTFEAKLVRALRDQCAVNNGLQADSTVVLFDLGVELENEVIVLGLGGISVGVHGHRGRECENQK